MNASNPATVARQREARRRFDLVAKHLQLGKIPDLELARLVGVTPDVVRDVREQRKIPPVFVQADEAHARIEADLARIETHALLGRVPDADLAKILGVTQHLVAVTRRRKGIAVVPGSPAPDVHRATVMDSEVLDVLTARSQRVMDIAKRLGCGTHVVRECLGRLRHGGHARLVGAGGWSR